MVFTVLITYSGGARPSFEVGLDLYSIPSAIPKLPLISSKWRSSTIFSQSKKLTKSCILNSAVVSDKNKQ
jgi:hypothetical protein